jgi:very-short-patch-repair endonuclease
MEIEAHIVDEHYVVKCEIGHYIYCHEDDLATLTNCYECNPKAKRKRNLLDYINVGGDNISYLGISDGEGGYYADIPKTVMDASGWFECSLGHKFKKSYNSFCKVSWCPECYKTLRPNKKTMENYDSLAKSKRGTFLGVKVRGSFIRNCPDRTHDRCGWKCGECLLEWLASYNHIQAGSWCPKCGGSSRKTIEDYDNLSSEWGQYLGIKIDGVIHRDAPNNVSDKRATWMGNCGHKWSTTYNAIQSGTRCPKCAGVSKITLEEYHDLPYVVGLNIRYLGVKKEDETYDNMAIPNRANESHGWWECLSCGCIWQTSFSNLSRTTRIRYGCPRCAGNERKTIFDYQQLLKDLDINGELAAGIPKMITDNCSWICNNCGLTFLRTFIAVRDHYFCPTCNKTDNTKLKIEDYEQAVISMGQNGCYLGKANSDGGYDYSIPETANTLCCWSCFDCGTEFETTVTRVKCGQWCRFCVKKTERILYRFLKQKYPDVVSEYNQEWCRKPETGRRLRFDFCIRYGDQKIIIEVDGNQHFEQVRNWISSDITRRLDVFKMKCALDNGYTIIRIYQMDVFMNRSIKGLRWDEVITEIIEENDDVTAYFVSTKENMYDSHKADLESLYDE